MLLAQRLSYARALARSVSLTASAELPTPTHPIRGPIIQAARHARLPKVEELKHETPFTYRRKWAMERNAAFDPLEYESLEQVGDLRLTLFTTLLIRSLHPELSTSAISEIRHDLLQTSTLALLSARLALPSRVRPFSGSTIPLARLQQSRFIQAEILRAYVNALVGEKSAEVGRAWVDEVFAPLVEAACEALEGREEGNLEV